MESMDALGGEFFLFLSLLLSRLRKVAGYSGSFECGGRLVEAKGTWDAYSVVGGTDSIMHHNGEHSTFQSAHNLLH